MADDAPSGQGNADRDGITDPQDEVLAEMGEGESGAQDVGDDDGVNDTEKRYGDSESPA